MKTIGVLGGTSWPSTIDYYRVLNAMVLEALGPYHSARICLYSIDYHPLKSRYAARFGEIAPLLQDEIERLVSMKPDCVLMANNTLHKAFDDLACQPDLQGLPMIHIVEETGKEAVALGYRKLLLLGTKFTMEDGYYEGKLEGDFDLDIEIPSLADRDRIQESQTAISLGDAPEKHFDVFRDILSGYDGYDAVVPACTELPLVVLPETTDMPILNPTWLQCRAAVEFALEGIE